MFLGLLPASILHVCAPRKGTNLPFILSQLICYTYIKYSKNNTEIQHELQTVADSSVIKVTRILSAMFWKLVNGRQRWTSRKSQIWQKSAPIKVTRIFHSSRKVKLSNIARTTSLARVHSLPFLFISLKFSYICYYRYFCDICYRVFFDNKKISCYFCEICGLLEGIFCLSSLKDYNFVQFVVAIFVTETLLITRKFLLLLRSLRNLRSSWWPSLPFFFKNFAKFVILDIFAIFASISVWQHFFFLNLFFFAKIAIKIC